MNQIIFQKCVVLCEFPFLACLRFPGFDSEKVFIPVHCLLFSTSRFVLIALLLCWSSILISSAHVGVKYICRC
jgi:hypothetical protein